MCGGAAAHLDSAQLGATSAGSGPAEAERPVPTGMGFYLDSVLFWTFDQKFWRWQICSP